MEMRGRSGEEDAMATPTQISPARYRRRSELPDAPDAPLVSLFELLVFATLVR